MKCNKCGAEVLDTEKFCKNCGNDMDKQREEEKLAKEPHFCPHCGTPHQSGTKFCIKCGYQFEQPEDDKKKEPNISAIKWDEAKEKFSNGWKELSQKISSKKEAESSQNQIVDESSDCGEAVEQKSKPKWMKWVWAAAAVALVLILVFVWIVPSVKKKNYYWAPMDRQLAYYNNRSTDVVEATQLFSASYIKPSLVKNYLEEILDYTGMSRTSETTKSKYQSIDDNIGNDWQIELTLNSASKMTKEELAKGQETFRKLFTHKDLDEIDKYLKDSSKIQKLTDDMNADLKNNNSDKHVDVKATKKLLKASKKYDEAVYKMHKAKFSEGYRASFTSKVTGSANSMQFDPQDCLFIRINGKWCMLNPETYEPMDIGLPTFQQQSSTGSGNPILDQADQYAQAIQQAYGLGKSDSQALGDLATLSDLYQAYEDAAYPTYEDKVLHKLDQIQFAAAF